MFKKILLLIVSLVIALPLAGCEKKEADFSETKAICELATLKCYYHNTSELKQDSSGIGKWFGNIGYSTASDLAILIISQEKWILNIIS